MHRQEIRLGTGQGFPNGTVAGVLQIGAWVTGPGTEQGGVWWARSGGKMGRIAKADTLGMCGYRRMPGSLILKWICRVRSEARDRKLGEAWPSPSRCCTLGEGQGLSRRVWLGRLGTKAGREEGAPGHETWECRSAEAVLTLV